MLSVNSILTPSHAAYEQNFQLEIAMAEKEEVLLACVCIHLCAYSLTFGVAGVENSISLV